MIGFANGRAGYHGQMVGWLVTKNSVPDPRKLFPEARSVIVVALNYYTPDKHSAIPDTGKISRYAWGDDYHDVVGNKLRALLSWIQQQAPGAAGKVCIDIQPMLDKAWAVRAGLGWLGKHTNRYKELGSWVSVASVLNLGSITRENEGPLRTCTLHRACPEEAIANLMWSIPTVYFACTSNANARNSKPSTNT